MANKENVQCGFLLFFIPEIGWMVKSPYKKLLLAIISTNNEMVRKKCVEYIESEINLAILVIVFVHTSID